MSTRIKTADTPDDRVLLLHALDGLEWAHFIATRLAAPVYNITCKISQLTCHSPQDSNDTTKEGEENIYCNEDFFENNAKPTANSVSHSQEKPDLPEKGSSRAKETDSGIDFPFTQDINSSSACVVLVTPNIVESNRALPLDLYSLKTSSTVFIFLGVDLTDARSYFGVDIEAVMKCRCGCVDSCEQQTITDALVQIIEAYEDSNENEKDEDPDDIYNVPTNTRQYNVLEKVFPKQLTETDRDVFFLLSWPPEDHLQLLLEGDDLVEKNLELTAVDEKLYTFRLPDDIVGDVFFHLECQGEKFGRTKIQVPTKLEQLRAILDTELDPLALLTSAVNLPKNDLGDLDVTLAHKLQQLSPAIKFQNLFPFEDEVKQSHSDRPSSVKWPTLLHFAAEWNLRILCSELLRYPGMVLAACTENSDREFPSQIASRKGFTDLETDLLQFVEKERESEYIEPSPPLPPPRPSSNSEGLKTPPKVGPKPAPKPHSKITEGGDDLYCDMTPTGKTSFMGPLHQNVVESQAATRPKSGVHRRLKAHMNISRSFGQGDADVKLKHIGLRQSSSIDDDMYMSPDMCLSPADTANEEKFDDPDESPRNLSPASLGSIPGSPLSQKALKRLGVCEAEVHRSSVMEDNSRANSLLYLSASCPPGRHHERTSSRFYVDDFRDSYSSNWEEDFRPYEQGFAQEGKRSLKKEKIKSFFSKIKGSKRANDGSQGKKFSGSKGRRGSESSEKLSKNQLALDPERDSGSYSDEETEPKTLRPRNNKGKVFKESDKPMRRRLSRRVESVKNETIVDYPTLPGGGDGNKSSFQNYF